MSAEPIPLSSFGDRVRVDTVDAGDVEDYRRAVQMSRERIRPWNPVNPDDLRYHLSRQSSDHRTFIIRTLDPPPGVEHDIVGKVNVTGITRGRAFSGVMGYDSYDPYAGQGLFAEGLRLVIDLALTPIPSGLGLNRIEAAVQPGNVRSAGLLRSIGLRRRGAFPAYLWLGDEAGREDWRDHVVYGVDRADWPASAYAAQRYDQPVVLVVPEGDRIERTDVSAARALARELGVPVVQGTGRDLAERIDDAVTGAVVLTDVATAHGVRAHAVVAAVDLADPAEVTRVALNVAAKAHR